MSMVWSLEYPNEFAFFDWDTLHRGRSAIRSVRYEQPSVRSVRSVRSMLKRHKRAAVGAAGSVGAIGAQTARGLWPLGASVSVPIFIAPNKILGALPCGPGSPVSACLRVCP